MSSPPRVVITGLGLFSPLGCTLDEAQERLLAGESGIRPVERFDCSATPGKLGGELQGYDQKTVRKELLKPVRRSVKVMCREIEFGVAAAAAALEDSGIVGQVPSERLGIDFGANLMMTPAHFFSDPSLACVDDNGVFDFSSWGDKGFPRMEPLWLLKYLPNMPACHIGILADARGPNNSLTQDEASGNLVVGEAIRVIHRGWADAMISGTTGTRIDEMKSVHGAMWDRLGYNEANPAHSCRPFDKNRNGQALSEGSAVTILETIEHAANRGAKVWGEVLGTGASCKFDADGKPDFQYAMAQAMRTAIKNSGLTPDDIGHVNAHGDGSVFLDPEEAKAIGEVFGKRGSTIPVTALKSRVGNSGASCGTVELALSLLAAREGVIPTTTGYETPDPECPLNVVAGEPIALPNNIMISNSVTRLGQASSIVVRLGSNID